VNVALFAAVLENCDAKVDGPDTTDQAPVPTVGAFAASVALPAVTHRVWSGPAFAGVTPANTVIVTSSPLAGQGEFEIVQRSVYVPVPPAGVNVAVGELVLENCAALVSGPEKTDQAPVPLDGAFAASVAAFPVQIVWSAPAAAVVGAAVNVTTTSSLDAVHGAEGVIVHRKVYVPAPPAGVNVALFAVVLENCDGSSDGPLTTDHAGVPAVGVFAANVALTAVRHRFWSGPAAEVVAAAL
jgi:hypothetical protein